KVAWKASSAACASRRIRRQTPRTMGTAIKPVATIQPIEIEVGWTMKTQPQIEAISYGRFALGGPDGVARDTEAFEIGPVEEQGNVALVLRFVVDMPGRCGEATVQAVGAEGVFRQVSPSQLLPGCPVVQALVLTLGVWSARTPALGGSVPVGANDGGGCQHPVGMPLRAFFWPYRLLG